MKKKILTIYFASTLLLILSLSLGILVSRSFSNNQKYVETKISINEKRDKVIDSLKETIIFGHFCDYAEYDNDPNCVKYTKKIKETDNFINSIIRDMSQSRCEEDFLKESYESLKELKMLTSILEERNKSNQFINFLNENVNASLNQMMETLKSLNFDKCVKEDLKSNLEE